MSWIHLIGENLVDVTIEEWSLKSSKLHGIAKATDSETRPPVAADDTCHIGGGCTVNSALKTIATDCSGSAGKSTRSRICASGCPRGRCAAGSLPFCHKNAPSTAETLRCMACLMWQPQHRRPGEHIIAARCAGRREGITGSALPSLTATQLCFRPVLSACVFQFPYVLLMF